MRNIFVSYAFNYDRDLASAMDPLLDSHDVRPVTGARLGGGSLTEEIRSLIEQTDGLVAFLTRRAEMKRGKQSPWLVREIEAIQSKQIPVTPVLIGSEDWVPEQLRDLPSLRLRDLKGAASVARQISDQLRKDVQ